MPSTFRPSVCCCISIYVPPYGIACNINRQKFVYLQGYCNFVVKVKSFLKKDFLVKVCFRKILPVFVDFFAVFKLHKGVLTCVLSLFSFFPSFLPLFLSFFFNSSFKFFPVFHFGQKFFGEIARIYIPAPTCMYASFNPKMTRRSSNWRSGPRRRACVCRPCPKMTRRSSNWLSGPRRRRKLEVFQVRMASKMLNIAVLF